MKLIFSLIIVIVTLMGCARTDLYYPADGKATVVDDRGHVSRPHNRAVVLNGSDSLGATHILITKNSLEFDNQGGIDNSTSTKAGYRTVRYGIGAAATIATAGFTYGAAAASYSTQQLNATRQAAISANAVKPIAAPAVGSIIPATIPARVVAP